MSNQYRKHLNVGPGGLKCNCCGPKPGKDRKQALRATKRGPERAAVKAEIEAGIDEWAMDHELEKADEAVSRRAFGPAYGDFFEMYDLAVAPVTASMILAKAITDEYLGQPPVLNRIF